MVYFCWISSASRYHMHWHIRYVSGEGVSVPGLAWAVLLVGCAVSFGVSMIAIRFLMDFVRKHSFSAFGIYRIALGLLVLGFFLFSRA